MICAFCSQATGEEKIYFRDECAGCGRDLHICKNCEFHDPSAHHECRESSAEYRSDKERANLCEYFRPATGGSTGSSADAEAKKQLEALFGK